MFSTAVKSCAESMDDIQLALGFLEKKENEEIDAAKHEWVPEMAVV